MKIFNKKNISKTNPTHSDGWFQCNDSGDTVTVFVHGFMSNSSKCWKSKENYWPSLLSSDQRLANVSIYMAGYYTHFNSGLYSISDCSSEIFAKISNVDADGTRPPIEKKNIVFVCHSLGGIVVRHLLEINQTAFNNKTIGLVLLASPSLGSGYADFFDAPIQFYKNRTAGQLESMNNFLIDLDDRFKRLLENKDKNFVLKGVEGIENHSISRLKYLPTLLSPIVNYSSGSRYFLSRTIPDTNHSSIVKPDSLSHPSHEFLVSFITSKIKKIDTPRMHQEFKRSSYVSADTKLKSAVIFDVLDKESIRYYLIRAVDKQIGDTVKLSSLWICGESGSGKTSAIRNFIISSKHNPVELCLSHIKSGFNPIYFFNEILITSKQLGLYEGEAPIDNPRPVLIDFLANHSNQSPTILYLDEIALKNDSQDMQDFVDALSEMLNSIKQRSSNSNLQILLSSIESPLSAIRKKPKSSEQIKLIQFLKWSDKDLKNLIDLIIRHIPSSSILDHNLDLLICSSNGSPRFIKSFFRNKFMNLDSSFDDVLSLTINQ